jgi:hypothetical protein
VHQYVVLLYNHGVWTNFSSPIVITDISPMSPDDIWAATPDDSVLHFQAGHWTQFPIGVAQGQSEGELQALSMTSDSDGWLVALGGDPSPQGMFLAHFDGHSWTRVPGPTMAGAPELSSIDMVSANEGWAGGFLPSQSGYGQTVLLHYVGERWQQVPLAYSGAILSICMVSASEVWAVVASSGIPSGATSGLLHYYNGKWTPYDPGQ